MEGPESDQQRSKRQDLSEKALDEGEDPFEAKEATISKPVEAGKEIPLRFGHQH